MARLSGCFRRHEWRASAITRLCHGATPLLQEFELGKELQRGRFGVVREARSLMDGSMWACKSIHKTKHNQDVLDREVGILKRVDHPGCMRLVRTSEDEGLLHVLSPLYQGGELFESILSKGRYTEKDAARCMSELLRAVEYLHQNSIVHLDIKPENIMLAVGPDKTDRRYVLIDFGMAMLLNQGERVPTRDLVVGSVPYCAPEVLNCEQSIGREADVWSCGVVMYVMLCGRHPFWGNDDDHTTELVTAGLSSTEMQESWRGLSAESGELVKAMLTLDWHNRPAVSELLTHPWLLSESEIELSHTLQRLKLFQRHSDLKRSGLQLAAELCRSPKHESSELHTINQKFDELDVANQGRVEIGQVVDSLSHAASSDDQLAALSNLDVNRDGHVSRAEFVAVNINTDNLIFQGPLMRAVFEKMDLNGNGVLDQRELTDVLIRYGGLSFSAATVEVERMLQQASQQTQPPITKASLSYQEFALIMKKRAT